ncbi:MAG: hypothetical protein A3K09_00155 [Nitrospinae bacterium RIFCSPLOWO2_12_FULL_47_7]|nr:MAG: hypothetical protein A3K09_00155 [Nitrospinae bacterium RIFCSPLOWO2_12_FULL_47_7]
MGDSNDSDRDFEKLSRAITEAVMRSEKVRRIVEEIQKKENICPQSFMVLVLSMQSLSGAMDMTAQEEDIDKKPPKRVRKKKAAENDQYIDGQRLTKNEIAFQEFINERFDADEWFRQHGISF